MRTLPVADPGTPDHRSPGRFLWWLALQQRVTLLGGMLFGILWMSCQAVMPAVLGRAIDRGVAARDESQLVLLGRRDARDRPGPGGHRDHAPPLRGDQLAHRVLPDRAAHHAPVRAPGRLAAAQGEHRRGDRDRHHRPRPHRQRDGRDGPVRRRDRAPSSWCRPSCSRTSVQLGLVVLDRRAAAAARDGADPQAAPGPRRHRAADALRPLQHRHRHRRRAAGAARDRRRGRLPRPLPPRVAGHPDRRRQRRQASSRCSTPCRSSCPASSWCWSCGSAPAPRSPATSRPASWSPSTATRPS